MADEELQDGVEPGSEPEEGLEEEELEKEYIDPKKFPRMIYHILEGQKIVNSPSELKQHFNDGWTSSPEEYNDVKALQAKICQTEKDLEKMKENLQTLLDENDLEEDDGNQKEVPPVIRRRNKRR